jgi:hypothetical protein
VAGDRAEAVGVPGGGGTVNPDAARVVRALVQAVRGGTEARIGELLRELAGCADIAALYALRDALESDLCARSEESPTDPVRGRAQS